ncbi:hypothetical protein ECZU51_61830 [Escherichia coli]|nr:hypothetical protein ECZU51_61830 [Escherichia coli]
MTEPIAPRWSRRRRRWQSKTQASLAQSEANRTDKLVHTNLVSREEWEQRRSAAVQAQADIRAAQAAVDAAQQPRLHQSDRPY